MRKQCEEGSRDWDDVTIKQGMSPATDNLEEAKNTLELGQNLDVSPGRLTLDV